MSLLEKLKRLLSEDKTPRKRTNESLTKPTLATAMEEKTEIKTYEIDRVCPKCGKGKMRPFGNSQYGQHEHHCNNMGCNNIEMIEGKRYPYVITERVISTQGA